MFRAGVAFLFAAAAFTACRDNDLPKVEDVIKAGEIPTEKSTFIDLIYTDSAKLKARMKAPLMIRYISDVDPKVEMPRGLHITFHDPSGRVNSYLKAGYGIRYINKNLTKVT